MWRRLLTLPSQKNYWRFISLGLITIVISALGFWIHGKKNPETKIPDKLVEVETIQKKNIKQTITLLGTIHPKHATALVAKGSGTLDALIPSGQKVKKGTLIAKIDNADVENNLQLSVSGEALAKAQFDRFSPLIKSGVVSTREAEEKKQAWIVAQKELSKTKIERDNLHFYAPFDGIIGAYKKREGAQVNPGEVVVTLYDPTSLVVDFDIPCSNLTSINEGQKVAILNKEYPLTHVQKMLDEETHMCPADVDIRCEQCLIGSTVTVDLIVAEKKEVIVIPYQALFLRNSKPYVYLVNNNQVELTAVTTGLKEQDQIEITEGLNSGQKLIIKGQERVYPQMTVEVHQVNTSVTS
ncbi:MAG TPA: efflux RND transporter periplasmic adaptor subunit [Legionella sp.]|nr:efflux RND transporter periplasmic adaptor subunit [Legionella sp.]